MRHPLYLLLLIPVFALIVFLYLSFNMQPQPENDGIFLTALVRAGIHVDNIQYYFEDSLADVMGKQADDVKHLGFDSLAVVDLSGDDTEHQLLIYQMVSNRAAVKLVGLLKTTMPDAARGLSCGNRCLFVTPIHATPGAAEALRELLTEVCVP